MRGENVTPDISTRADETAHAFEDGWFHTGDIGEIGADGQVFIRGRKKEMIVTPEGLNVFPEDVERVLNQMPGVRDSAVVGAAGIGRHRRARPRGARRRSWRDPDEWCARRTRSWTTPEDPAGAACGPSRSCREPKAHES